MRRIFIVLAGIVLALVVAAPVLAADPKPSGASVLMAFNGDITVEPNEQVDVVMVTDGTASIAGEVKTVVVMGGTANLTGATVDTIAAIGGSVSVDGASAVTRDVPTLAPVVQGHPAASLGG